MKEAVKRFAPTKETVRELFAKSGNLCAFPSCNQLMMNADGVFIGQVCHIEAATPGGERFNPQMTNESRRNFRNLMLMCYEHHQITNDVQKYPVEKLVEIKLNHEKRFSHPDRAILAELRDWTTSTQPSKVKNLKTWNDTLGSPLNEYELEECVTELNEFVKKLSIVPVNVRIFAGKIAERIVRVSETNAISDHLRSYSIVISDVIGAFNVDNNFIRERIEEFRSYGLGDFEEVGEHFNTPAISLFNLKSGWPIWIDLAEFCNAKKIDMSSFTEDLNFSLLDETLP